MNNLVPFRKDEVWLGLETAYSTIESNGHKANPNNNNCKDCFAMYLLSNAMRVYREREALAK